MGNPFISQKSRFLRYFFVWRYSSEVDVDFVRKSIKAIGQTAIKIETAAERCVNVLLELIATRVSYVVQEAVVVMKVSMVYISSGFVPHLFFFIQDIFRRYPSTYEGVIPTLCANLDELEEPEAKASLIWIIGEYANKINNADSLLGFFVDSFTEESYPVSITFVFFIYISMRFFYSCSLPSPFKVLFSIDRN